MVLPLIVGSPDEVLATLPFIRSKRYLHRDGKPDLVEKELQKLVRRQVQVVRASAVAWRR